MFSDTFHFILYLCAFLCLTFLIDFTNAEGCTFPAHLSNAKKAGEGQIAVLMGNTYSVSNDEYTYKIGICTDAVSPPDPSVDLSGAGVVQFKMKGEGDSSPVIIGKYTVSDIVAGPEWVMLEYNGGAQYGTHCGNEGRRARIMFICDMSAPEEAPIMLEEQNNKTDSCYYLFEIGTAAVCPKQPLITVGLSVGSVLLIVFFSLMSVYLIGGCLYNRFVLGAKGLDQFPNKEFWEDFGNLQADGCALVCRSRKYREPKSYKGIGDDQLQDDTPNDENLLPM